MFETFNFFKYFLIEDLLIIFFIFAFFSFLISSSVVELIWPTQYFNKKNSIGLSLNRFRTFLEFSLKLRNTNYFYFLFLNYFFYFKFN